ncbi:MAG TPA: hypothetical protein VMZ74_17505 [Ramlibacter sp.]|nr:hypothetical protein [Ramlibacter sp.]
MRRLDQAISRKSLVSFGAAALFAITAAAAQVAAPAGAALDTTGDYNSEVRACMTGKTGEDQATCMKEARNARADKQRGALDANSNYAANARARCAALSGEDKAACDARMLGYGTVSGSVAGGGVLREVETVVMPAGQGSITIDAKTADPVVLVPAQR